MNIYQNIEVYYREYDSKLLSSILSAGKNNVILLSPLSEFKFLLKWIKLPKGIFHNKSLTPSKIQYALHQKLNNEGFLITSLDEEHGLHWNEYEKFGKLRFSQDMVKLSSYVFCWGNQDLSWLKNEYPQYKDKFILSGAPRVDFWRNKITTRSSKTFKNKYIFYPSNFIINNIERTWNVVKLYKSLEYDKRDPEAIYKYLKLRGEQYLLFAECIKAIEYISDRFKHLSIIVRPHPRETIESWREYLGKYKNVHIIRDGSITDWIHNSEAIIHNGCTSALEATISKIPVITYKPKEKITTETQFFNQIGKVVKTKAELVNAISLALDKREEFFRTYEKNILKQVEYKIHQPKNKYSSEIISDFWNKLKYEFKNVKSLKDIRFKIFLFVLIFRLKNSILSFFTKNKDSNPSLHKYPGISKKIFKNKFENLCMSIGIDSKKFKVFYISPRVQMIFKK